MLRRFVCAAIVCLCAVLNVRADVSLPSIFGSQMVLQRDKPVPVWGWAAADEEVTVSFGEHKANTKADDKGNWKVSLPAMKANASPQKLKVVGKNTVEFDDVLVGEVWVGSGQSNMEWSLLQSGNPKETIAAAKHPKIRLFHVHKHQAKEPAKDITPPLDKDKKPNKTFVNWKECTPVTAPQFSAVLYHFGVRLQKELDVPIGLINSSWGGSRIEPWTPGEKVSGGMYNAMIAPLMPFAIRGVVWYQGESNMGEAMKYYDRKKLLVDSWRKVWGEDMPFYFVQIAPWTGYKADLGPFWEAQTACLKIPQTGMVVTTDLVDDVKDIHPKNKTDVGNRLALWALAKTYGKKGIVYSGPLYKSMKIDGDKITLSFAHVGGGLKSRDDKDLSTFEIAGEDGKFVKATAKIEGETVVVQSAEVKEPKEVRFGWSNTTNPNLANKEGLPATPFRTKDWQGGTGE